MKTVIEMAIEAGLAFDSEEYPEIWMTYMNVGREEIKRFAELVRAEEAKRADALAAAIAALRDIVTSDVESKSEFIARVRDVLGSCPDHRVLNAVVKEREACAALADKLEWSDNKGVASAIRARSEK